MSDGSSDVCSSDLTIVFRLGPRWQRAAVLGDALDMAAQFYLLGKQIGARAAIVGALARPALGMRLGHDARRFQVFGRRQGGSVGHVLTPCVSARSEVHTSELQSLMRISYAVFCL